MLRNLRKKIFSKKGAASALTSTLGIPLLAWSCLRAESSEQKPGKLFNNYESAELMGILNKNSDKRFLKNGCVEFYTTSTYNANEESEDTLAVSKVPNGFLFGVFDGHSGKAASLFCKTKLFSILEKLHRKNPETHLLSKNAFLEADKEFFRSVNWGEKEAEAGACAVVAHTDKNLLRIANLGDCRCVVARKNEDGTFETTFATEEHQIGTNENERLNFLKEHPFEEDVIRFERVKGGLQPTRGFGDGAYKHDEIYKNKTSRLGRTTNAKWKCPYTSAEPKIDSMPITNDTKFMILTSDGISDELSPGEMVDCVSKSLYSTADQTYSKIHPQNPHTNLKSNPSAMLIKSALTKASERNFGNFFGTQIEKLLSVKPGRIRRRMHDDMTAMVVVFAENKCYPQNIEEPKDDE